MAKRNPRRRQPMEDYYALSIETWELDYSFSVANEKWHPGEVYADSRHLSVQGTLSHPRKSAGRLIRLTFVPANNLLGPTAHLYKSRPQSVGCVTWSRNAKAFDGVLSIPETALPLVVSMLLGERFRHVMLTSNGPFRGSLDVASFRFIQTLTADYFPAGEW